MPVSLKTLASRAQDLYFQDAVMRDSFFDVKDFMFHAAAYYSTTLNSLYKIERQQNKVMDGFTNTEISAAWMIKEKIVPVKNEDELFILKPEFSIFSFDFDSFANGIQNIRQTKNKKGACKCDVIKISNNESSFLGLAPTTSICYYYLAPNNEIILTKFIEEAEISYIPTVVGNDVNCVLSDNIAADVIKNVLTIMFGAKNGNVVQMTNDGNNNPTAQNQANPALNKNLQAQ